MLTVNKFLCFELEAGGKFVGWLGLIASAIGVPIFILEILYFPSIPCTDLMELVKKFFKIYTDEFGLYECNDIKGAFVNLLLVLVVVYSCVFILCFLLLRGIATQSHKKVLPVVILEAVTLAIHSIFLIYVLFTKGPLHCFFFIEILACILAFYFFTVLFSLYVKFRDGTGRNVVNIQLNKQQHV